MQMTNELLNPPTELRAKIEHAGDEAATKPTQNAFIESFNARLRVKCVNEHVFRTEHALRGV
ncbi:MAG: transposase, partial [Myxococcales bacterium]|nr:transposase [Myxococcales bacterium]